MPRILAQFTPPAIRFYPPVSLPQNPPLILLQRLVIGVKIILRFTCIQGKEAMEITNILAWIIVGGIAGWLASIVMKTNTRQGCLTDIIVGIIGGFIGGFVLTQLGIGGTVTGINIGSILVAFLGAVILLAILQFVQRPR
jgi:uncharacterized membrane protein YeaQ/YmgE (transglycosylase-associated protein family)